MCALLDARATVRLEARRRSLQAGSLEEHRFDLELDTSYPALLAVAELYDLIGGLVSERRTGALPEGVPELRSEEHTSELQSLMRNSYAVFCLKTKTEHYHNRCDNVHD